MELAILERSAKRIEIPSITWQRIYPATLFDSESIPRYIQVATENMLIEFEHDLIDSNPNRLLGSEKREFVR